MAAEWQARCLPIHIADNVHYVKRRQLLIAQQHRRSLLIFERWTGPQGPWMAGQRDPCTDVLRRSRLMMRRGGLGSVAQRLPAVAADMTATLGVVVLSNLHLLVAVSPNVSVRRGELVGTVAQTCPQRRPRRADLPAACGPHNVDLRWRTDSNVYHPFPRGRPPHTALTSGFVPAQR